MSDALIAHFHEIGLKGRNRDFFETQLARNLKRALRGTGYSKLRRGFGRMVVDFDEGALMDEAAERAARVFGVAYIGVGKRIEPDLDQMTSVALELLKAEPFDSFAIRARRTYSSFETKSQDINIAIGSAVVDELGARVDLKHSDATVWIELFGSACIAFRKRLKGPGGLPAGVSGRMLALLSGGIDSPVAAWRMARRGAEIELVHFHGKPFTDPSSIRQATELAEVFTRYQLRTYLHLIPLGDIQREIVKNAPSNLRVILYRRTMMRIAEALAAEREAQALVTGDSLGQVASQTIENIRTVDAAVEDIEVLRPLVGMDKQEIVEDAKAIGTYEISTRKYQDCCVLFEPRSPATRANPFVAERGEEQLDIPALVGKALAEIETRVLELPPV
ncbi:MAG: tRNA uracil 4-sulfurtransferase [Actinomycetota bacterium]|jgi:thiamine biosynthesis protein ThiI|nr:tRNA uracil 4-sulfurtransferase [Actinomycetota bacterium]